MVPELKPTVWVEVQDLDLDLGWFTQGQAYREH